MGKNVLEKEKEKEKERIALFFFGIRSLRSGRVYSFSWFNSVHSLYAPPRMCGSSSTVAGERRDSRLKRWGGRGGGGRILSG